MTSFPFPYAEVEFDRSGSLVDAKEQQAAVDLVGSGITDVLVISHGWNNDMDEARALYLQLATSMKGVLGGADAPVGYGDRRLAVVGVLWPSKKFADSDLIPGGAASVGHGADADDIRAELADLKAFIDRPAASAKLDQAAAVVDDLGAQAATLVDLVRDALAAAPRAAKDDQDASKLFFSTPAHELAAKLEQPVFIGPVSHAPSGVGGAAGFGDALSKKFRAARNLLNYATYYEMKARAGVVGGKGVAPLLAALHTASPTVRIHLAGHSFGARVVSMAALSTSSEVSLSSVSLLQAAFSHYGFSTHWEGRKNGLFLPVLSAPRLAGPMIVTHTVNDRAVGIAYAIASRIAGQVAESVGGPGDKFGGLGRNGALLTLDTIDENLLPVTGAYDYVGHRVHNLLADAYIHDHSDVRGPQVAKAVLSAISFETD